jgi:LuxR family maltose regulon positive regulatory protein
MGTIRHPPAALPGKLHPPPAQADAVPRRKLLRMLEEAKGWRILLLRAPAGYGKTTLMAQLYARLEPCASCHWLTLDPRDDDPRLLLAHLRAALRLDEGAAPTAPDLGVLLDAVARRPGPLVLFLDECETVREPAAGQIVRQLLRFAPDNLRIVAGTRPGTEIAPPRMKASGGLLEWTAQHLRFDDDETRALLPPQPPGAWLAQAAQRCEGWPAARRLSLLALRHGEQRLNLLHDSRSDLAEYLASEVFAQQPPQVQHFLLCTCLLRYMTPPLCDALCERTGSAQVLEGLAREYQFVTLLDQDPGQGGTWRYHPLLQDFLRRRLHALHPERVAPLHRKAALWLQAQGDIIEALGHALECGEPAFAAALLDGAVHLLVQGGQLAIVQRCLARLPAHVAEAHPGIVWAAAWAHTYFHQEDEAKARLAQLQALPCGRTVHEDRLALEALLVATHTADAGETLRIAGQHLQHVTGDYPRGILLNVRAYGEIAFHRFGEAQSSLDAADQHNRRAGNLFGLSAGRGLRAAIWSTRGELRRALACYHTGAEGPVQQAVLASGLRCELLYETGQLDGLQALLALHQPAAEDYLVTGLVLGSYLIATRLQQAQGNAAAAHALIDKALARAVERRFELMEYVCRWEKVRLHTLAGETQQAWRLAPEAVPRGAAFHFAADTEANDIALLRLQIRSGQALQALPAIERHRAEALATQRGWRALKLSVLRACALGALGREAEARQALADAMHQGSQQGFVRSLADEGEPVTGRIAAWLADSLPPQVPRAYAEQVLAAGGARASRPAPGEFSGRERALLAALAQGQQNKEMAQRLGLSENTVKWYLKRLYAKLDARNRAQAIAQARLLGL